MACRDGLLCKSVTARSPLVAQQILKYADKGVLYEEELADIRARTGDLQGKEFGA